MRVSAETLEMLEQGYCQPRANVDDVRRSGSAVAHTIVQQSRGLPSFAWTRSQGMVDDEKLKLLFFS